MYIIEDSRTRKRYFRQSIYQHEIDNFDKSLLSQFNLFLSRKGQQPDIELRMLDIVKADGSTHIIYEHCGNLTMHDLLASIGEPLGVPDTMSVVGQILRFYLCHESAAFHRDMKLENIYVTGQMVVKVGGLDVAVFGSAFSSQVVGTPFYMAPEVGRLLNTTKFDANAFRVTNKADIYSIGVMTLELLTGYSIKERECSHNDDQVALLLDEISYMDERQEKLEKLLSSTTLISVDPDLYRVIRMMIEPIPENRCSFNFLYEYFNLYSHSSKKRLIHQNDGIMSQTFVDKLGVLCDPNVLKVAELRKLFFMRVDHEYCLIQFLIYGAKEIWDLGIFNFGDDTLFDSRLRSELITISTCLALKAMMYLTNLKEALQQSFNLFFIKDLELYMNHQIFKKDVELIQQRIAIADDSPVKTFFNTIMQVLEHNPQQFSALAYYAMHGGSKTERQTLLDDMSRNSILEIVHHPGLEVLQVVFEKYLKLIEDCIHDKPTFKFRNPLKGIFCWSTYLSSSHPHLKNKFELRRIRLPSY